MNKIGSSKTKKEKGWSKILKEPALKRLFDLVLSLMALIILAPIFFLIAIGVLISLGPPIFFKQVRPGLNGKPFTIIKFRTMLELRDDEGELLPNHLRLTPFGSFLRRYSLDELPELINVIKGDMSLVGPRPLRMYYLDRYTPKQASRHKEKPGITGWAQVNGRNLLTWKEKFEFDVWYVNNRSLCLDIKIILLTVFKVVKREGINPEGHLTMPEFMGTKGEKKNE